MGATMRACLYAFVLTATSALNVPRSRSHAPRLKTRRCGPPGPATAPQAPTKAPQRQSAASAFPHAPTKARHSAASASAVAVALTLAATSPAAAATSAAPLPSALAAYAHYAGLIGVVGALVTERITLKEDMSDDEFDRLANADIAYGVAGVLVLVSGYERVTQYGKGWDFYAHEPIFWCKMVLFAIMGSASYFPTIKIVQHAIAKKEATDRDESIPPPSPALVKRMTSIVNAELLAVASIPLAATLMARGVAYADWLPWQAGAAPVALALGGFGYKYAKEALDWQEA